ncbi:MarR family winged helix-turn-helix transcriptional regulator [Anaerovibrio sp.]|uniref:MarR family winged helix-turn-helix transcriptional regulator n=1 Tax=Anaerovibrio sp. TaxID=1872532 RepID=UPI003F158393
MENRKIRDELESLVSFIRQKHKEFLVSRLQPLGVKTSSRGSVLYAVYENEGLVQEDISSRLSMDKAFVTRELNALGDMGLIKRLKDPQDHRRNHIFLTDRGRELGEAIVRIEADWVNIAYAGFSAKEFSAMQSYSERISENIKNA